MKTRAEKEKAVKEYYADCKLKGISYSRDVVNRIRINKPMTGMWTKEELKELFNYKYGIC